jgi:murein DD-endopeptidase MepM/ murein hydrolase activator NlpD
MPDRRPRRAARLMAAALLCATAVLSGGARPTSADDVGNASSSVTAAQNQLNTDNNKKTHLGNVINTLSGQIAALQTRVAQVQAAIATVDAQIAVQLKVVADAQAKLQQISKDLDAANLHLVQARARLKLDQEGLSAQIVHLYELGPTSTVNAIFSSDNFDEMWQKVIAAKRVGDAEQSQVDQVKQERAQVEALVIQITGEKQQQTQVVAQQQAAEQALQQDRATRVDLQHQLEAAQAADEAQKAAAERDRQQVQNEIAADAAAVGKAKSKLAAAEAAAAAAAAASGGNAGSFHGGGNGHFLWPMQGGISQYWGCTSWPYERYVASCPYPHEFHDGLDISAPCCPPIVAADAGLAHTYYSWGGYGLHVVIIHGNGWATLYGHMSGFAIHDGQFVGRGQVIGSEGSTGNSSGPHVHFEIDVNGGSVNPLNYLP